MISLAELGLLIFLCCIDTDLQVSNVASASFHICVGSQVEVQKGFYQISLQTFMPPVLAEVILVTKVHHALHGMRVSGLISIEFMKS